MPVVRDFTALLSNSSFNGQGAIGRPVVVTYSFETLPPAYLRDQFSTQALSTYKPISAAEKAAAIEAMRQISAASGIKFVEAEPGLGDVRFAKIDFNLTNQAGFDGFAYYPNRILQNGQGYDGQVGGDVFINTRSTANLYLMLHEIGHAVGLKHTFDGNVTLASDLDNHSNTVMSYTGSGSNQLGRFDVDALRYIYGASAPAAGTLEAYNYRNGMLFQTWGSKSSDIAGTNGNDSIDAGGGNDQVAGFAGNDRLTGGTGNDTLIGGLGNDLFNGGAGDDKLFGGSHQWSPNEGKDTADYRAAAYSINVRLEGQYVNGSLVHATGRDIGNDVLYSIEDVWGGRAADDIAGNGEVNVINGYNGDDKLYGRGGNDTLYGGSGADEIWGEVGNDKLYGDSHADVLFGGEGNDILDGGASTDKLSGGEGRDKFMFGRGSGRDTITDFEDDIDTICFATDLWSGSKSVSEVLRDYAVIKNNKVVLDFGGGDVLIVEDASLVSVLRNDILLI